MNTKRFAATFFVLIAVAFSLIPTAITLANDASITLVAQYRQDVEVTLDLSSGSEISSLDPGILSDNVSIEPVENLFLRLTDLDPVTNDIRPEIATSWSISDDGLVWTFHLRDDVNWMDYDPAIGEAETLRSVVADDFVFGIKRACDPRLGGYYGTVLATVLAGCDVVNQTPDEEVTDELVYGDTTHIIAIDDTTLVIRLQFSAGYFLSMTTMWMMSPLPQEAIATYDDDWTAADNIVTNGPYFLEENLRGVRRIFVKNDNLPDGMLRGNGNIDRITHTVIEDGGTSFALYQDNLLDATGVPAGDLDSVLSDTSHQNELSMVYDVTVFYFGFRHDKPPFDNVYVRRAFSAIIDRQAFIDDLRDGRGVPMIHFTPPGMVNSPPIDDIGVGFDPDYAREQMILASYPNCEGFPNVDMITYIGAEQWGEFLAAEAEEHLGCDPASFRFWQIERNYWEVITEEQWQEQVRNAYESSNMWTLGWGPDNPDANNWVGDVLGCEGDNAFGRPCSDVDEMIVEAATEIDQERRAELYRQIEDGFFGPDGEYPIAPIFLRAGYLLFKTWYTGPFVTDGIFGGAHWETRSIDMAAKLAAREE